MYFHQKTDPLCQEPWIQMVTLQFSCSPGIVLLIWWPCLLRTGREECNIELRAFLGTSKDHHELGAFTTFWFLMSDLWHNLDPGILKKKWVMSIIILGKHLCSHWLEFSGFSSLTEIYFNIKGYCSIIILYVLYTPGSKNFLSQNFLFWVMVGAQYYTDETITMSTLRTPQLNILNM